MRLFKPTGRALWSRCTKGATPARALERARGLEPGRVGRGIAEVLGVDNRRGEVLRQVAALGRVQVILDILHAPRIVAGARFSQRGWLWWGQG